MTSLRKYPQHNDSVNTHMLDILQDIKEQYSRHEGVLDKYKYSIYIGQGERKENELNGECSRNDFFDVRLKALDLLKENKIIKNYEITEGSQKEYSIYGEVYDLANEVWLAECSIDIDLLLKDYSPKKELLIRENKFFINDIEVKFSSRQSEIIQCICENPEKSYWSYDEFNEKIEFGSETNRNVFKTRLEAIKGKLEKLGINDFFERIGVRDANLNKKYLNLS